MHTLVGSGVIGEELITSFRKKEIILNISKFESGALGTNGEETVNSYCIRTKYINVKPNTKYNIISNRSNNNAVRQYKNDNTFISRIGFTNALTFVTNSKCYKIRIVLSAQMDSNPNVIIKRV